MLTISVRKGLKGACAMEDLHGHACDVPCCASTAKLISLAQSAEHGIIRIKLQDK